MKSRQDCISLSLSLMIINLINREHISVLSPVIFTVAVLNEARWVTEFWDFHTWCQRGTGTTLFDTPTNVCGLSAFIGGARKVQSMSGWISFSINIKLTQVNFVNLREILVNIWVCYVVRGMDCRFKNINHSVAQLIFSSYSQLL